MSPAVELSDLRRRFGALEYELAQLKQRLVSLEAQVAPTVPAESPPAAERSAPVAEIVDSMASVATPPLDVSLVTSSGAGAGGLETGLPPPLPAAPPSNFGTQPSPPAPNPLRGWLEPLQLWPPEGETNAEVRLAAWWATRVGALFAVIGVVFLGVYVSKNSPSWVRLLEISTVTAVVLGMGLRLERRLPKFGAVVFGAGLALAYFCAFAAYAVAPMKVITNPLLAMACELAVVGGIFVTAWRRDSQLVASMAVALGYVTAFLALPHESVGFGPWVVLLLGVAAVALKFAREWNAPSALAMPLTWLFLLAASFVGGYAAPSAVAVLWFWTALYFALFMARDGIAAWRGGELTTLDRAVQVVNSTFAVLVGLRAALRVGGDTATGFFIATGIIMLAVAWSWQRVAVKPLVPIFVCKGAGLIALGVIDGLAGHARCLVLLAQAFVMLVSARQSPRRWLQVATVITGVIALAFFIAEFRPPGAAFGVGATALETAFLCGALAFVAALGRWAGLGAKTTAVGGAVIGVTAILTAGQWQLNGWTPAAQVGLALLMVAAAGSIRGWLAAGVAGGLLLVSAHAELWIFDQSLHSRATLWWNALIVLGAAVATAPAMGRLGEERNGRMARAIIATLATSTLVAVFFKALTPPPALAATAGLGILLVALASAARGWPLVHLAGPLLVLGYGFFGIEYRHESSPWLWVAAGAAWLPPIWLTISRPRLDSVRVVEWKQWVPAIHTALATATTLLALSQNLHGEQRIIAATFTALAVGALTWRPGLRSALEASWIFWGVILLLVALSGATLAAGCAAVLCWVPAIFMARRGATPSSTELPVARRPWHEVVQVALAATTGFVLAMDYAATARFVAFGALTALATVVWRWGGVSAARGAAAAVAICAWLVALQQTSVELAQGWSPLFAAILTTAAVASGLPFILQRELAQPARNRARWLGAAAGMVLAFVVLETQRGVVAPYVTVGWGIAATGTFLAGLIARSRPHRLCGLAGLALCIPRAFVIDLHSTLHRIAAFVALGVVLLWVGFSYHRFRHLIDDDEKKL